MKTQRGYKIYTSNSAVQNAIISSLKGRFAEKIVSNDRQVGVFVNIRENRSIVSTFQVESEVDENDCAYPEIREVDRFIEKCLEFAGIGFAVGPVDIHIKPFENIVVIGDREFSFSLIEQVMEKILEISEK